MSTPTCLRRVRRTAGRPRCWQRHFRCGWQQRGWAEALRYSVR